MTDQTALERGMALLDHWRHAPEAQPDDATNGRRTSWTVGELLAAQFPEPRWAVRDLLPTGLALLAGRPKLGKSFLALQLSIAVSTGGMFLDRHVEQGGVLYIALEDSPRRLQKRLRDMGAPARANMAIETTWPPLNGKGLGRLDERLAQGGYRLIVVDTLTRAMTAQTDWDRVGQVTGVMGALQTLAQQHDVCLLLIDHHRKGNGMDSDLVDDVLGSTGKAAVCDTIWGLYRRRGKAGATLRIVGRDVDEQDLALAFHRDTRCWQSADAFQVTEQRQQILDAVRRLGEARCLDIAEAVGRNKGTIHSELQLLVEAGLLSARNGTYMIR